MNNLKIAISFIIIFATNVAAMFEPDDVITMANDNQSIMLSTFGRQVFRSADGGTTWNMVFDNSTGGSNHRFTSQRECLYYIGW